jgi:hypothetical protein
MSMVWVLIIGIVLTTIGILVGLYLPILAAQFSTPEKIRIYLIMGAALVVIGTACEVVAVLSLFEAGEEEQQTDEAASADAAELAAATAFRLSEEQ